MSELFFFVNNFLLSFMFFLFWEENLSTILSTSFDVCSGPVIDWADLMTLQSLCPFSPFSSFSLIFFLLFSSVSKKIHYQTDKTSIEPIVSTFDGSKWNDTRSTSIHTWTVSKWLFRWHNKYHKGNWLMILFERKKVTEKCSWQENAEYAFNTLSRVRGLSPVKPSGAMYIMVGLDMKHFPSFSSDLKMMEKLVAEESVFALPGQCFDYPNFMRLVLTLPKELTAEACNRIASFSNRHYVEYQSESKNVVFPSLNPKQDNKESGIDSSLIRQLKTWVKIYLLIFSFKTWFVQFEKE